MYSSNEEYQRRLADTLRERGWRCHSPALYRKSLRHVCERDVAHWFTEEELKKYVDRRTRTQPTYVHSAITECFNCPHFLFGLELTSELADATYCRKPDCIYPEKQTAANFWSVFRKLPKSQQLL